MTLQQAQTTEVANPQRAKKSMKGRRNSNPKSLEMLVSIMATIPTKSMLPSEVNRIVRWMMR
ncbi:MAG: hypothetical protein COA78_12305 [Blastopirellula sp.]|nr:MAG: hypothetical protein COA78_12305 [Blastopirellula sp.]